MALTTNQKWSLMNMGRPWMNKIIGVPGDGIGDLDKKIMIHYTDLILSEPPVSLSDDHYGCLRSTKKYKHPELRMPTDFQE